MAIIEKTDFFVLPRFSQLDQEIDIRADLECTQGIDIIIEIKVNIN
jgi:hypothetical protein